MEVDDSEVLFYLYSERFLSKGNVDVTDKLTIKLMKTCVQRSDYGVQDIEQLHPMEQWILKQMIEEKLAKKFNRVKNARNDASKKRLPNNLSDAQRRDNRRKTRIAYVSDNYFM